MKIRYLVFSFSLFITGCTTLNDSLQLGAGLGGAAGAITTYTGYRAGGHTPSLESVAIGAAIGSTVGMITSYFVHKKVEDDRNLSQTEQTEMHFGDLPPSPFIVPNSHKNRKGDLQ